MFTVRGSPQQIDYARQLVEEKIGVNQNILERERFDYLLSSINSIDVDMFIRDLSLPWVAHMALLDHMGVQAHMVLLVHLVLLELPWAHITQGHTTRDLPDHSKYSVILKSQQKLFFFFPTSTNTDDVGC